MLSALTAGEKLRMFARGGGSLVDFVPMLNRRERFKRPYHLRPFTDLLQRADGERVRACISVPPRHSKTETLIAAIVYWLLQDPTQQILYAAHTAPFARGRMARAARSARYAGIKPGPVWRQDEWTTAQGGRVLVRGIRGPITGEGFDKILIDDPCKDRLEAESPLFRERNWEWLTGVASTRLASAELRPPGGSMYVVHTRWHDDDLIGRLSKLPGEKWEVVNLPAICVDPKHDPLGRKMNDALWPEVWTREALEEKRYTEVFEYEWAAQYMGQPVPKGGRVFHEPAFYDHPKFDGARIFIGCDPAAGGADYSAIVVLAVRGIGRQTEADVLEVYREQISIPDLVRLLVRVQAKWNAPIVVEAAGGFKAVPQMLLDIDPSLRVEGVTPIGKKFERAQPSAAAWNDVPGRIRVPSDSPPWLRAFLDEVCNFTGVKDAHDDQVDALSHAFNTALDLYGAPDYGAQPVEW